MNVDFTSYKHLSFDLWLTLIKSNPEFKIKRDLLFKEYFEINCSLEEVSRIVRYYDVLCNNTNEKTGLNIETFEIYLLILNALNVSIIEIDIKKLKDFYTETEFLFLQFKPDLIYPNIHFLFNEITDKEKTISILSNTGFIKGFTLRKLLIHYGLEHYFSFQIYSDETGFSKPNYKMFELVYDQIENKNLIQKRDILHIGDNEIADYSGAINFGFNALLIKN